MASGQKDTYSAPNVTTSADIRGSEANSQTTVKTVALKWMVKIMENNLYRIEVIAYDNLPKIDTVGMLMTNDGIAFVKLHPVKLKAQPKNEAPHGQWKLEKNPYMRDSWLYRCTACDARCGDNSRYCPNCGAKMGGGNGDV